MPGEPIRLRLLFCADALEVRAAVGRILVDLADNPFDDEALGLAEVVLAEALNNIVEHAYAGQPGELDLRVETVAGGVRCLIVDHGRPMPGGAPPEGHAPRIDPRDLPEGGFGWFLIRALARDIGYRRCEGRNHLSFLLPADIGKGAVQV